MENSAKTENDFQIICAIAIIRNNANNLPKIKKKQKKVYLYQLNFQKTSAKSILFKANYITERESQ